MDALSASTRPRGVFRALLIVFALTALAVPAIADARKPRIEVMTRNIYIGTDLTPVVAAPNFPAFLAATAQAFNNIQASDFPARAKALAAEIDASDPHLIGLQEVELIRRDTVPPVLDGPASPATTVVYDFLSILRNELAARGAPYNVVSSVTNADIEVPTGLGFDARVTDHDVILARAGLPTKQLSVGSTSSGTFATQLTLGTAAGPVTFTRGWSAANVTFKRREFKLVNTHLEAFASPIRTAQAQELLAGPLNTGSKPAALVGDINSPPDEATSPNAYDVLTDAGFADAWVQANGSEPGLTCCHAANLLNADASVFDSRIDVVFTRGAAAPARKARITGIDPDNRTPAGQWPSDHAGVWAKIAP
jgi:hypothetical protein